MRWLAERHLGSARAVRTDMPLSLSNIGPQ